MELRPQPVVDGFNPGRGVNETCLEDARGTIYSKRVPIGCIAWAAGSPLGHTRALVNHTEFLMTASNQSKINRVLLGQYQGSQFSLIGPAQIPSNLDFQATTYGSHTQCRVVTSACGAQSTYGVEIIENSWGEFSCNATEAGLNMTGTFDTLGTPNASYVFSHHPTPINDSTHLRNMNTFEPNDFHFGFQYFNDSAKQKQAEADAFWGFSEGPHSPITNTTNQIFWALAFQLASQLDVDGINSNDTNPWAYLGLATDDSGTADGIFSCQTNISEIVNTPLKPPQHLSLASFLSLLLPIPFLAHNCLFADPYCRTTRPILWCPIPSPSSPSPHLGRMHPSPSSTASPPAGAKNSSISASHKPARAPPRQLTSLLFSLPSSIKHSLLSQQEYSSLCRS